MKIADFLKEIRLDVKTGNEDAEITGISDDSRKVKAGHVFLALKGKSKNGEDYINEAIERGSVLIVLDRESGVVPPHPHVKVDGLRDRLWDIASFVYAQPDKKMKVIGVTGTNGKTTTVFLIEKILRENGFKCGVIGTIEHRVGDKIFLSNNTTPGCVEILSLFDDFVKEGADVAVMEVSSHALEQNRTGNLSFYGSIFTNLGHDHLDYHRDMENYFMEKKKIFSKTDGFMLANNDDRYGKIIIKEFPGAKSYGLKADFSFKVVSSSLGGLEIEASAGKKWKGPIKSDLVGGHNAYNLISSFAAGVEFGIDPGKAAKSLGHLSHISGRLERVKDISIVTFVDYAHTPDALEKALISMKELSSGKVICVFGCGGNRDKEKRPKMGSIAEKYADKIILTADNSRWEDTNLIIKDILSGIGKTEKIDVEENREKAIEAALKYAGKKDFVLIAGRGHETLMEIKGQYFPFNDAEIIRKKARELKIV
ncbi:MAG: UDP-N-acetylmuramoyl-L-alanyl-D-glutamate--2,6-diaminopimelate ligase [Candidatus Aureabacteria bacterium]|nr:UDP-N-acetylmuramoyl-L-alanyl-D-glutamate--2,6-diaminopimelate ligase [Candidatus Auribacterota bacterium]